MWWVWLGAAAAAAGTAGAVPAWRVLLWWYNVLASGNSRPKLICQRKVVVTVVKSLVLACQVDKRVDVAPKSGAPLLGGRSQNWGRIRTKFVLVTQEFETGYF